MEQVHKNLEKVHQKICFYLSILSCTILVALVSLDLTQACLRYLANSSSAWGVDLTLLLMQAFAWCSAVWLWLTQGHIVVDFFSGRFQFTRHLWIPANIAVIIGVIWLLPDALTMMKTYHGMIMPALPASASIRVVPMFCGLVLLGLAALLNTLLFLTAKGVERTD